MMIGLLLFVMGRFFKDEGSPASHQGEAYKCDYLMAAKFDNYLQEDEGSGPWQIAVGNSLGSTS
jgi:hypothetical protein